MKIEIEFKFRWKRLLAILKRKSRANFNPAKLQAGNETPFLNLIEIEAARWRPITQGSCLVTQFHSNGQQGTHKKSRRFVSHFTIKRDSQIIVALEKNVELLSAYRVKESVRERQLNHEKGAPFYFMA